jgi:hypothetical protein
LRWQISQVHPQRSYTLEMPLDRAMLSFEWRFERGLTDERDSRNMWQLSGDNAAAYAIGRTGRLRLDSCGWDDPDRHGHRYC